MQQNTNHGKNSAIRTNYTILVKIIQKYFLGNSSSLFRVLIGWKTLQKTVVI